MKKALILWLAAILVLMTTFASADEELSAVNVVVLEIEGTVQVCNQSGKSVPVFNNMKLHSGYEVTTGGNSYAWMSLDDTKVAGLDADSNMAVKKQGKQLVLLLDEGNMFFDVQQKLEADETMNIRTSNMVMGITGTFGVVRVLDSCTSEVLCLDGGLNIHVFDPVSGENKGIKLMPGEMAAFHVESDGQLQGEAVLAGTEAAQPIAMEVRGYGQEEIDPFVLRYLNNNPETLKRIENSGGGDLAQTASNWEETLLLQQQER